MHGCTEWHWVRCDAGSEDEGGGSCKGEGLHGECSVLDCDLSLRFSLLLSLYFIPDHEGPRVLLMVGRLGLQCTQVASLTMSIHVIQVDFLRHPLVAAMRIHHIQSSMSGICFHWPSSPRHRHCLIGVTVRLNICNPIPYRRNNLPWFVRYAPDRSHCQLPISPEFNNSPRIHSGNISS